MPKGYWIVHATVEDLHGYEAYRAANAAPLAAFGGQFLVRAGRQEIPEGSARPRTVVIEFASYDDAVACYRSEGYQAAMAFREPLSQLDFVIAEGPPD